MRITFMTEPKQRGPSALALVLEANRANLAPFYATLLWKIESKYRLPRGIFTENVEAPD
jgi:hypothetical protein